MVPGLGVSDRYERMSFLLRRNAGRLRAQEFVAQLTERLRRPITTADLLPLERTDVLWEVVRPALRACRSARPPAFSMWSPEAMGDLAAGLIRFAEALSEQAALYLPGPELGLGPLPVGLREIMPHMRSIAEAATEECTIVGGDGLSGIRLDYQASDHDHGERFPYELCVWGSAWVATALRVLPFERAAPAA
jgi:hypothetical protein